MINDNWSRRRIARIASNPILLNFGRTRPTGRSSHGIGDGWTPSSEGPVATPWRTRFTHSPYWRLRPIDTQSGSRNSRYVKSFFETAGATLPRPDLPAPSCECYWQRRPTHGSQLALFAAYRYHGCITDRDGDNPLVKDGEKMYRVGGPIADSGVVVQRFCQFKWKATLSV